ncbi:MAG: hypothetical protein ACYST3_00840 [Planctomycetota bacterium]|jgi:hypothetical protein
MNYTEQYIKVLKQVNKASESFHILATDENYSDTDKKLLTELINSGYINCGRHSPKGMTHFTHVTPTVKGRIFQDELEQKQNERTFKGRITKHSSIIIGVLLALFCNVILEIVKNVFLKNSQ